jgi:hypothetical protein
LLIKKGVQEREGAGGKSFKVGVIEIVFKINPRAMTLSEDKNHQRMAKGHRYVRAGGELDLKDYADFWL